MSHMLAGEWDELSPDRGRGEEARHIRIARRTVCAHEAQTIRQSAIFREIGSAIEESSSPGWDGEGALPVSREAVRSVVNFCLFLSDDMPVPSIHALPTGSVELDWHGPGGAIFSAVLEGDDLVHFAWRSGVAKFRGVDRFTEIVPDSIVQGIERVIRGF